MSRDTGTGRVGCGPGEDGENASGTTGPHYPYYFSALDHTPSNTRPAQTHSDAMKEADEKIPELNKKKVLAARQKNYGLCVRACEMLQMFRVMELLYVSMSCA